jgi:hypothetical protein
MYQFLLSSHNILRWVVLIVAFAAIIRNYMGWKQNNKFLSKDRQLNSIFIGFLHLQLVIGLILYSGVSPMMKGILQDFAGSMKIAELRFWSIEHITGMILGIAVAQVGSIKSKKAGSDSQKFKTAFIYFLIGTLIILAMIPFGIWNVERPHFRGL